MISYTENPARLSRLDVALPEGVTLTSTPVCVCDESPCLCGDDDWDWENVEVIK